MKSRDNEQGRRDRKGRRHEGEHHHEHDHGHGRSGRGRRQPRGDVRATVLLLLAEEPLNGYQIIQTVSDRSHEMWRISPGSIYPILQQLEDEGLVVAASAGTGRTYELTDAGRQLVAADGESWGTPWIVASERVSELAHHLGKAGRQVGIAAKQVLMAGTEDQAAAAITILEDARRALYSLLATDDADAGE